jgi:hypothetical protein
MVCARARALRAARPAAGTYPPRPGWPPACERSEPPRSPPHWERESTLCPRRARRSTVARAHGAQLAANSAAAGRWRPPRHAGFAHTLFRFACNGPPAPLRAAAFPLAVIGSLVFRRTRDHSWSDRTTPGRPVHVVRDWRRPIGGPFVRLLDRCRRATFSARDFPTDAHVSDQARELGGLTQGSGHRLRSSRTDRLGRLRFPNRNRRHPGGPRPGRGIGRLPTRPVYPSGTQMCGRSRAGRAPQPFCSTSCARPGDSAPAHLTPPARPGDSALPARPACPTPPTRPCLPDRACPTAPARPHLPDPTCPTPPARPHLPDPTCPTPPARPHQGRPGSRCLPVGGVKGVAGRRAPADRVARAPLTRVSLVQPPSGRSRSAWSRSTRRTVVHPLVSAAPHSDAAALFVGHAAIDRVRRHGSALPRPALQRVRPAERTE